MSDPDLEPERGESYLEIQMDRSTIVLAGLAIVACLLVAFLAGRWTAGPSDDAATPAGESAELGEDETPAGASSPGVAEDDVDGEPLFGGRAVSAQGAKPLSASPRRPVPSGPLASGPAGGSAPGSSTRAAEGPRTVTLPPAKTVPTRTATTSAPAKSPTTTARPAGGASVGAWVIQVAALTSQAEAGALEKRLVGKGYPVRIAEDAGYFKVQVGPFADKSEAEVVERKLKRDEKVATWLKRG